MRNRFDPIPICPFFNDDDFKISWQDWQKARKKMKAVFSDYSTKRHLMHLMKLCEGKKDIAIKIVNQSTDGGKHPWTKLYPLKEGGGFYYSGDAGFKEVGLQQDSEVLDDFLAPDPEFDEVRSRASEARSAG